MFQKKSGNEVKFKKKTGQGTWLNITANKAYIDLFRTMPIIPAAKQTVRYPLTVQSSRRPKQLEMSSFAKHKLSEKQKERREWPNHAANRTPLLAMAI